MLSRRNNDKQETKLMGNKKGNNNKQQQRNYRNNNAPVNRGYQYKFDGGKLKCTIRHRELLSPVTGGDFSQVSYKI